jgi:hypothetical protein
MFSIGSFVVEMDSMSSSQQFCFLDLGWNEPYLVLQIFAKPYTKPHVKYKTPY